jgi:hypothetical protein
VLLDLLAFCAAVSIDAVQRKIISPPPLGLIEGMVHAGRRAICPRSWSDPSAGMSVTTFWKVGTSIPIPPTSWCLKKN